VIYKNFLKWFYFNVTAIQELLGYLKNLKEKYGKIDKETIQMSILLYCALK